MVGEKYWRPNAEDIDRMRRKQAEFLVKTHVPASCIIEIIAYSEKRELEVKTLVSRLNLNIQVIVRKDFYY